MKKQRKKITIIIPTYNEEKDILNCLNSLLAQSYKNFEIIVVDDCSTDKTIEIVKNFAKKNKQIKILKQNHKGPGEARNFGAKKSKGEILIFADADMTFHKDYLKNLIKPILEHKKIIGTTHELEIVTNTKNIWSRCWGKIRVSKKEAKDVKIFRAIRKKRFFELGGFDPKYGYADDQTFWFKYKIKPVVAPRTICYHKNPETLKGVYKQSKWIGSSYSWLTIPIANLLFIFLLTLFSPLLIFFLSIKKCWQSSDFKIFPYMIVFITIRYLGTLSGNIERALFKKHIK